jgi:tRNA-dihydrouridine synthase
MNVDGFLINPEKVIKHLQTTTSQQPIAQIYGGNESTLIEAAMKIEREYGEYFSGIELNTGCPSTTVMKCGGGSELMKNRKKTLTLIKHLSEHLEHLPFSIKTRTGINETDKKEQADFLLEASQYCSKISIHGRTLKQLYNGEADRTFIQQIKQHIKQTEKNLTSHQCQIIGNGGITSYQQAKQYNEHYEVDGIMIGQAAIGNPRIFTPHLPTKEEKLQTILRHLDLSIACDQLLTSSFHTENFSVCIPKGDIEQQIQTNLKHPDFEAHSIVEFRKFLFQYIKGIPDSREWKQTMISVQKYGEMRTMIQQLFEKIP